MLRTARRDTFELRNLLWLSFLTIYVLLPTIFNWFKGPAKQRSKDRNATNTSGFGEDNSVENRILPSHGVRETFDVHVPRAILSTADMPDELESMTAQ